MKIIRSLCAALAATLSLTSAGASPLSKLIQQRDAPLPGFFRSQINLECGSVLVRSNGVSGTVNGHTINVSFDPVSRVLATAVDGNIMNFDLDEKYDVIEGRDAHGHVFHPAHLPASAIEAAVRRDLPLLRAALKACGLGKALAAQPKCLDVVNSRYPVGGKDCMNYADMGDASYWTGLLSADYVLDPSGWQEYMLCQSEKDACNSQCEAAYSIANVECGMAAPAGPEAVALCAVVAFGLYENCKSTCTAICT